jgi:hypothetical protein
MARLEPQELLVRRVQLALQELLAPQAQMARLEPQELLVRRVPLALRA